MAEAPSVVTAICDDRVSKARSFFVVLNGLLPEPLTGRHIGSGYDADKVKRALQDKVFRATSRVFTPPP